MTLISELYGPAKTKLLHMEHQATSGTVGGTATTGAWQTRPLTTVVLNEITGASLGSNQFTLPGGDYEIQASAPSLLCR